MLTFAAKYGRNVYSQNGEDGIIEEIINRIQPDLHTAVEFGAPSWDYCSNTAYLADKGWTVEMFDIDPNDRRVTKAEITPENINQVIGNPTVLSIDVDNNDYHLWNAYIHKPPVVVIEINSSIAPDKWEIPGERGASFLSMCHLGYSKGYFLCCHTGNLIFIRKDFESLFPEVQFSPFIQSEYFFNRTFL